MWGLWLPSGQRCKNRKLCWLLPSSLNLPPKFAPLHGPQGAVSHTLSRVIVAPWQGHSVRSLFFHTGRRTPSYGFLYPETKVILVSRRWALVLLPRGSALGSNKPAVWTCGSHLEYQLPGRLMRADCFKPGVRSHSAGAFKLVEPGMHLHSILATERGPVSKETKKLWQHRTWRARAERTSLFVLQILGLQGM